MNLLSAAQTALIWGLIGLSASGCLDFSWDSGEITCGMEGECPKGMTCVEGVCIKGIDGNGESTESNGVSDRGIAIDGGHGTDRDDTGTDADLDTKAATDDTETETERKAETDTEDTEDTTDTADTEEHVCRSAEDCPDAGACAKPECDAEVPGGACVYSAEKKKCAAPECGGVLCDDGFHCVYTPEDGDCMWAYGTCEIGLCEQSVPGEPSVCSFIADFYGCDPGETCDSKSDFTCTEGDCHLSDDGPSRLTFDSVDLPFPSYKPSVVATADGFAMVWIDWRHGGNYDTFYFATFDEQGRFDDDSVKRIDPGGIVRYPTLFSVGTGFILVFQKDVKVDTKDVHEVFVYLLDSDGEPLTVTPNPIQASNEAADHGGYPSAAYAAHLGDAGRIGIVWNHIAESDTNWTQMDVHCRIFDIATNSLLPADETTLFNFTGSERYPVISASSNGFVAVTEKSDNTIYSQVILPSGEAAPTQPLQVSPGGKATKPLAIAWNGADGIGVTWRSTATPGMFFRTLDNDGAPVGAIEDGLWIGGALASRKIQLSTYSGSPWLDWDADARVFLFTWDASDTTGDGEILESDVFFSRLAGDGSWMETPWNLSDAPGRSSWPCFAVGEQVDLVVWHDNRAQNVEPEDTWIGELYATTLDCR